MGRRASWIGVFGVDRAEALESLGLVETGQVSFEADADLCCTVLPSGWIIVLSDRFPFGAAPTLRKLPARCSAVACQVWDVISYSGACGFEGGREVWSVVRNPDHDPAFQATGDLPPHFSQFRDAAVKLEAQDDADGASHLLEVPLRLTQAICGFRPDESSVPIETVFHVVEPARSGSGRRRQEAERSLRLALQQGVEADLIPLVRTHGFDPVAEHPAHHALYPMGGAYRYVRHRQGLSETLWVRWELTRGAPIIHFNFFVREGAAPRQGHAGWAGTGSGRRAPLLDRLLGHRSKPEAIAGALEEARLLVGAIDRHLREGAPHPLVRPAGYLDETGGG